MATLVCRIEAESIVMSQFVWEHGRVLGLDPVDWLVWISAVVGLGCIVGL
jgi:hypothetical protein